MGSHCVIMKLCHSDVLDPVSGPQSGPDLVPQVVDVSQKADPQCSPLSLCPSCVCQTPSPADPSLLLSPSILDAVLHQLSCVLSSIHEWLQYSRSHCLWIECQCDCPGQIISPCPLRTDLDHCVSLSWLTLRTLPCIAGEGGGLLPPPPFKMRISLAHSLSALVPVGIASPGSQDRGHRLTGMLATRDPSTQDQLDLPLSIFSQDICRDLGEMDEDP